MGPSRRARGPLGGDHGRPIVQVLRHQVLTALLLGEQNHLLERHLEAFVLKQHIIMHDEVGSRSGRQAVLLPSDGRQCALPQLLQLQHLVRRCGLPGLRQARIDLVCVCVFMWLLVGDRGAIREITSYRICGRQLWWFAIYINNTNFELV